MVPSGGLSKFKPQNKKISLRKSTVRACICVDCKWVTNCKGYKKVEDLHSVKNINKNPKFDPVNAHVQILWPEKGNWLTYEYDLYKCDSFKEDKGAW